jgi:hypothetical protein
LDSIYHVQWLTLLEWDWKYDCESP